MDFETIMAALAGEASEEELRRLAEWRAENPANEWEYRRLARLWVVAGELDAANTSPAAPDARDLVAIATRRSMAVAQSDPTDPAADAGPRSRTLAPWWRAAIAASVVVGAGIGIVLSQFLTREQFTPEAVVTGVGQVATVTLADGTIAQLAPESRLEFTMSGSTREVDLWGRAYFAVARNPERPFRVRVPAGVVEVLGTRFDVQSRDRDLQVAVVEGTVRMAASGGEVTVQSKQIARSVDQGAPEVEQVDDIYEHVDWLGFFLVFQSTPMHDVADELRRRFGVTIEIVDDRLAERTITAWFADQTPTEMVRGICQALNARCSFESDGVVRMSEAGFGS